MTLTNTHHTIIRILQDGPATYKEIADELDCSLSTARDHLNDMEDRGIDFEVRHDGQQKVFGITDNVPEHPTNNNPDFSERTTSKRKKCRELTDHMNDMEARLRRLLNQSEPAVADGGLQVTQSNEDVVIHRTDGHFGDVEYDEFGNEVFNSDITQQREEYVTDQVMQLVARQNEAGVAYDTAHLLLGGDMVTGENTFGHQQAEIKETLDEQIDMAFEVYMEQIKRLSERFPTVQVVCVPGNHGELEASYSNGANADRLLYMMMDKAVRRDPDLDNVTFIRTDSTSFTNFYVRTTRAEYERSEGESGWKFHLRHGDDSLEHIGTSAGKRRWYNWLLRHDFDQAYRGHYHKLELDSLHGDVKVLMTASPKPPSDYEESMAEWTAPSATVHGVSDRLPMTWFYPVRFEN